MSGWLEPMQILQWGLDNIATEDNINALVDSVGTMAAYALAAEFAEFGTFAGQIMPSLEELSKKGLNSLAD